MSEQEKEQYVQSILNLAKTGTYRRENFASLSGIVPYRDIPKLIKVAKSRGMYTVRELAASRGDTCYQYDD